MEILALIHFIRDQEENLALLNGVQWTSNWYIPTVLAAEEITSNTLDKTWHLRSETNSPSEEDHYFPTIFDFPWAFLPQKQFAGLSLTDVAKAHTLINSLASQLLSLCQPLFCCPSSPTKFLRESIYLSPPFIGSIWCYLSFRFQNNQGKLRVGGSTPQYDIPSPRHKVKYQSNGSFPSPSVSQP